MVHRFIVNGLCCAGCAARLEEAVSRIEGCGDVSMAFMTGRLTLEAPEDDMGRISGEIGRVIRRIEPKASARRM